MIKIHCIVHTWQTGTYDKHNGTSHATEQTYQDCSAKTRPTDPSVPIYWQATTSILQSGPLLYKHADSCSYPAYQTPPPTNQN